MVVKTDLYSILVAYAYKNNSPYIGVNAFLDFIENYAKKLSEENPEWLAWVRDKTSIFWQELTVLTERGRCQLQSDASEQRIYLCDYHTQRIQKAYENSEQSASQPFPSESSLGSPIPDDQKRTLKWDDTLLAYLFEPHSSDNSAQILVITFPDGLPHALVLPDMIPQKLTEIALLKIRHYLRKDGDAEFILRKLIPQFHGREASLRDQFNQLLIRPLDCFRIMETGGEFVSLFWMYFCIALKKDIKTRKGGESNEIAASQAAYVIDTINAYYKVLATKQREKELAFKCLEARLAKPPFDYTLDQISKFTNNKGVLLLSQYSETALEEWLKRKSTENEQNALPPLLIMRNARGDQYFVLKTKLLSLCSNLLGMARSQVKEALSKHWSKLISEFSSEPAMENDDQFEKLLVALVEKHSPLLATLLDDPKLQLVCHEAEQKDSNITPSVVKLFDNGRLLPYSTLLFIERKSLLFDVKLMLPLWYSIPFLTALIGFFKNLSKKKGKTVKAADEETKESANSIDFESEQKSAVQLLIEELVPEGFTLDSYMGELERRWGWLIDKRAQQNLVRDVKSLIRDDYRRNMQNKKQLKLTRQALSEMAKTIIDSAPSLASINGKDSLILYAEMYLLSLKVNSK